MPTSFRRQVRLLRGRVEDIRRIALDEGADPARRSEVLQRMFDELDADLLRLEAAAPREEA